MTAHWMLMLAAVAGAWRAAEGGRDLSELPPVPDPGPCVPQRNNSAPTGLNGYRRYFANDSLIGRPVPCTRDDKICFRHNLIFDPRLDRCEPIGGGGDFVCDLRPNRTEIENGGRLIGVCKPHEDPCPGYRMAYDGRCYRKEVVHDVICGCRAKPVRHFLEGVECRSSLAIPIHIEQPEEEGHCLIPDLRFPDTERSQFFHNPFSGINKRPEFQIGMTNWIPNCSPETCLNCDSSQSKCFAMGKLKVKGYEGCYELLNQGPCPRDYIAALDIRSAIKGQAEGTCVHVRGGCPQGYKRLPFDGQCHEDREIEIGAPGYVTWNEYGQNVVVYRSMKRDFPLYQKHSYCILGIDITMSPGRMGIRRPTPPCGLNNDDKCDLHEVEAEPPIPEL